MNYLNKKSVGGIDVAGKRVLVHYDFNVPFDDRGNTSNPKHIGEALKTIRYLVDYHAKVILCPHLGCSKGKFNPKYSSAPVAEYLSKVLGQSVQMARDVIGDSAKATCVSLKEGEVTLLENVCFHEEEGRNDLEFSKALVSLTEVYVSDAFGTAHRAHASIAGMAAYLPAVCGYLIQKEIIVMGNTLANLKHPFTAILGDAKASDKIGVISNLLDKVDTLITGGDIVYVFMRVLGHSIGTSICENDKLDPVQGTMTEAKGKSIEFLTPLDNVVADKYDENANHHVVDLDQTPDGWMGLDTGLKTQELSTSALEGTGAVVWDGSMGVSEWKGLVADIVAVAKVIAKNDAVFIVGGGDPAAAVGQSDFADKMTHISIGGDVSLEFPEGPELPGIVCLNDKS